MSSSLNRPPPYFSESVCTGVFIEVMSINYKFWSFRKAIQNFNNINIKIIPILSEKLKTHEDYHIRIWWDRVLLSFPKNRTGRKPTKLSLRVWYLINWKFYIFKRNCVWSKKTYNTESFFNTWHCLLSISKFLSFIKSFLLIFINYLNIIEPTFVILVLLTVILNWKCTSVFNNTSNRLCK